ncbi:peptide chain release factor 2 [Irregularibacter muris]|uniref:Peptide chain release factor 2 n=2 Tax=Irregularibacter muris TaxID=1796619 RepID=A0AAE3HFW7_9FIRM|nr:peptide chain release factor 2 [Irregularibacter muris]MCR1899411.1 peptide chain release factor 2 [Irregularibacter muris]
MGASLDLPNKKKEIEKLEKEMSKSDFWEDIERAQQIGQKNKELQSIIEQHQDLQEKKEDIEVLIQLTLEENDSSMLGDIRSGMKELRQEIESFKLQTLLKGDYDHSNAILAFHAGAGGTEAQDWVEMLLRMYIRWAEQHDYRVKTLDYLAGDDAGVKSATILVSGLNAYGFLKSEKGVHRLVRISPFDTSGRRHTSFASLDVMPEIDEEVEVDIRNEDLKIDTYRSGGAGGQHVNTTDSAIRITHLPTGIVVQCQNERSQHLNKEVAMKMLKSKLIELKESEQKEKIEDLKGEYNQIAWGSQIRSYVFHPYNMVKDHRTSVEVGNIQAVMDGEIDEFIHAYLKAN